MAWCKRLLKIGADCGIRISTLRRFSSLSPSSSRLQPYGNRTYLNTLALMRSLEAEGFTSKQAEAITSALREVFNVSQQSFVSKEEIDKVEMVHLSKFNSNVKSFQEHHPTMLHRESEKLRADMDRMTSELQKGIAELSAQLEATRYEVIKCIIVGTVASISVIGLAAISSGSHSE